MSDEAAFLRAIAASADDAPRLVFADWLADRDDPRAAWVRDADIWEWMRPDARDPLPALVATLGDRTDWPRMWRARAVLLKLGDRTLAAVCDWLREDPERWPEMRWPGKPPDDLRTVAELIANFQHDDLSHARGAVRDLQYYGPTPAAVHALHDLAWEGWHGDVHEIWDAVWDTVGGSGPAADRIVPTLSKWTDTRMGEMEALERIRPDPELVLRHISRDRDDVTQREVYRVDSLDPFSPRVLIRMLQRGDLPEQAAIALREHNGSEAVMALIEALHAGPNRSDHALRGLIAESLGEIGDAKAIPALEAALPDVVEPDWQIREARGRILAALAALR